MIINYICDLRVCIIDIYRRMRYGTVGLTVTVPYGAVRSSISRKTVLFYIL
jgi:hypothetical protein